MYYAACRVANEVRLCCFMVDNILHMFKSRKLFRKLP